MTKHYFLHTPPPATDIRYLCYLVSALLFLQKGIKTELWLESKVKSKSVLCVKETPKQWLAEKYQETADKWGPILAKAEFRAKSTEPDYIPHLTMITHSKELWIPVQQINSLIIHEARMIRKWLPWRNWYQTSPLAINNHQTGQNILSNSVQALDNRREGQLIREIFQTPQQLSAQGGVPATSPGGAQHYMKLRRQGSECGAAGAAGAAEICGVQQRHRGHWWRDWRPCVVPSPVWGWAVHMQSTTPGLPDSGSYRVKHNRHKRPSYLRVSWASVQRLCDNPVPSENVALRIRVTP